MPTTTVRMGKDAQLWRGTAGSQATANITDIKDVTITADIGTADVTTRTSAGYRAKKPTLTDLSIEFKLLNVASSTHVTALRTAAFAKTAVALWARDHVTGEGPDADFYITSFGREEALEDGIWYSVKAEACDDNGRSPTWS
ncbi:MAG: hypothetical protein PHU85_03950 [Phycisphaerae bacterium]|nr:hypothetical protein [Phycisphaerae bacterium]